MPLHPETRKGEIYLGHVVPGQAPYWRTTRFGDVAYDHQTGKRILGRVPFFVGESELEQTLSPVKISMIKLANAGLPDPCPGESGFPVDSPPELSIS